MSKDLYDQANENVDNSYMEFQLSLNVKFLLYHNFVQYVNMLQS
jgi:hypothetical protein